jgi:hypothetical protein
MKQAIKKEFLIYKLYLICLSELSGLRRYVITFAAPSVADVQAAIEYIFPLVYEYRKERTKEDLLALQLRRKGQKRKRSFSHIHDIGNDFEGDMIVVSGDEEDENCDSDKSWD